MLGLVGVAGERAPYSVFRSDARRLRCVVRSKDALANDVHLLMTTEVSIDNYELVIFKGANSVSASTSCATHKSHNMSSQNPKVNRDLLVC